MYSSAVLIPLLVINTLLGIALVRSLHLLQCICMTKISFQAPDNVLSHDHFYSLILSPIAPSRALCHLNEIRCWICCAKIPSALYLSCEFLHDDLCFGHLDRVDLCSADSGPSHFPALVSAAAYQSALQSPFLTTIMSILSMSTLSR